jgi:cell division protein FtsZ
MNRRDAIKTLTVMGAMAMLPKGLFPFTANTPQLHFVGLGGGGCNALEYIQEKGIKARYTCITSPERTHLPGEIAFVKFDAPQGNHFMDEYPEMLPNILTEEVKSVFSTDHYYILLAAMGGFTGTKLALDLSGLLQKSNQRHMIIASIPFSFEGRRKRFAVSAKNVLVRSPYFKWFEMDMIRKVYGDMTLSEAFIKADEQFYNIFKEYRVT